ncbi:MAG: methyl-accepting chemotaxis protein [Steroidobacteraceae bacterium]
MRINQPVTHDEYVLPEGEVIVTRTDTQSLITYANQAFLDSSGFELNECMGQPQNIVRHPDMPEAAFADLWRTIQNGRPWTGIVKNRRKNGGFYWVRANVTPIVEDGQITGYMSVRVKPTQEEILAADQVYAQFRNGLARDMEIREGQVIGTRWPDRLRRLLRVSLSAAIHWASVVLAVLFFVLAVAVMMQPGMPNWKVLVALCVAGWLVVALFAAYLLRQVARPLHEGMQAAILVAGGDIRRKLPETGAHEVQELFRMLNQMNTKLVGVLIDTRLAIDAVMANAHEIAQGNHDLSLRTSSQAASLEQMAASMEEITSVVKQTADNAGQANLLADKSSGVAGEGRAVVGQVVETMSLIAASSKTIASIVSMIDSVAFQTNILALNAAVEAARAGEAGRGFAVVAAEVGTLAKRSATSAREIKELINDSLSRVNAGTQLVDTAGTTIQQVEVSVKHLATTVAEITAASREQSAGVEQINQAMTLMDRTTQQNAALVEEVAATAERLDELTQRVLQAVSAFKLDAKSTAQGRAGVVTAFVPRGQGGVTKRTAGRVA